MHIWPNMHIEMRKKDQNFCAAISNQNQRVTSYIDNNFSSINSINKNFFDKESLHLYERE